MKIIGIGKKLYKVKENEYNVFKTILYKNVGTSRIPEESSIKNALNYIKRKCSFLSVYEQYKEF